MMQYLRRCQAAKCDQKQDQPEYCIHRLDRELRSSKQQRKQRDMPSNSQGAECTERSPVLQGYQTERDDDKQDRFLMHMPPEEERGVAAEGDRANENFPSWLDEKLDERNLRWSVGSDV